MIAIDNEVIVIVVLLIAVGCYVAFLLLNSSYEPYVSSDSIYEDASDDDDDEFTVASIDIL